MARSKRSGVALLGILILSAPVASAGAEPPANEAPAPLHLGIVLYPGF
jgi:hypothetical protein